MTNQIKNIAVLGSTGSIGTQTLEIIARQPNRYKASVLVAGSKVDTLIEQCRAMRPELAVIADQSLYPKLKEALQPLGIETAAGPRAVAQAAAYPVVDTVVTATVGYSGLAPTMEAIKAGKDIALANKETLVVAGELVSRELANSGRSRVIPVDSEHSAIYQCLAGEDPSRVKRLIITASGGPFRTTPASEMANVTVAHALRHPNWSMGAKITIDSATMMNKAFEIIEARWLFDMAPDKIDAIVHPQSIVHSMVEFVDGAIKAQLGVPDMKLPISYALGDASRIESPDAPLTFEQIANLTFEQPDPERFPCLTLGKYALNRGGNSACVINAANEVAVAAFLRQQIRFVDIYPLITETLDAVDFISNPCYNDYVDTNSRAREVAAEKAQRLANQSQHPTFSNR